MYLSPSSIHFTNCTGQTAIHEITKETDIERLSRIFVEKKENLPKIQVVQKEGHYFTLNNTQLQVFRRLEEEGYCHNVKAEVVAMKRVPLPIRQMMTLPDQVGDDKHAAKESHRVSKNGSKSDSSSDENDDNDDDDDSLSSYSIESNSENDASDLDDDDDDDSDEESSTDASTEEELEEERESLL